MPPITAPSPSVAAARKVLRGYTSTSSSRRHPSSSSAAVACETGARAARVSGSTSARSLADAAREVADPEEAEDEGDDGADGDRRPADDEAGEDARDPDREADRPEARRRQVWLLGVVLAQVPIPSVIQPLLARRVSTTYQLPQAPAAAPFCTTPPSAHRASGSRTRPSGGRRGRAPPGSSRSPPATRACPRQGPSRSRRCRSCRPTNWSVGAWSRWSSGPSVSTTSRFGSTFAPT